MDSTSSWVWGLTAVSALRGPTGVAATSLALEALPNGCGDNTVPLPPTSQPGRRPRLRRGRRSSRAGEHIADCDGVRVRLHTWMELHDPAANLDSPDVGRLLAGLHGVCARRGTGRRGGVARRSPRDLRTCHRDLWAGNVRRTRDGGLCVFDFDDAGLAHPSQELAVFNVGTRLTQRMRRRYGTAVSASISHTPSGSAVIAVSELQGVHGDRAGVRRHPEGRCRNPDAVALSLRIGLMPAKTAPTCFGPAQQTVRSAAS
jgi:hypothetical protein